MKRKIWLLIVIALVLVAALVAVFFLPQIFSPPASPSTLSPSPLVSLSQTVPTTGWGDLPTVTPPGPGEPTLPPEAQAMQAAPTATPSPIPPPPSPTQTPIPTPTPVPATGYDDVLMVEVSAGEFTMGITHQQAAEWLDQNRDSHPYAPRWFVWDQTPQLVIYLDTFSIDQFEVTIERYGRCVEAGICRPVTSLEALLDNFPVVDVTWHDANTYCQWVGKRLPTEAEWEKAARGIDGWLYPWGDEWNDNRANRVLYAEDLRPVGYYPDGSSPYGVLDMGGNAYEWVADLYGSYLDQSDSNIFYSSAAQDSVVRGRDEGPGAATFRLGQRQNGPLFGRVIGFRCAQGPRQDWRQGIVRNSLPPTPVPVTPDLSQMAYVPASEFVMGTDGEDLSHAQPVHTVYLDEYYIDRYEVTVQEFAAFLNDIGGHMYVCGGYTCTGLTEEKASAVPGLVFIEGKYQAEEGMKDWPVVGVTWYGAQTYCEWTGKRLPTEAEWEKAARGTDGRKYPWGDEWHPDWAAGAQDYPVPRYPVGSYPNDRSPYGVMDMLGNATEWVLDWFDSDYYERSPYANPINEKSSDVGHVTRGLAGPIEEDGLAVRRPFGYAGFRCIYMPDEQVR